MSKGPGQSNPLYLQGTRSVIYIIANSVFFHYLDCSAGWQAINGRCVQSLTVGKNLADSKVSATIVWYHLDYATRLKYRKHHRGPH